MNQTEARAAWVAALRSGQYAQGRAHLCKESKHCCLGVACELAIADGVEIERKICNTTLVRFNGNSGAMPLAAMSWLGLREPDGSLKDGRSLASLNDQGYSFEALAQIIESNPEGLFAEDAK